jgi:hypothetical protein
MKSFITRLIGKIFNNNIDLSKVCYQTTTITPKTLLEQSIDLAKANEIIPHEVCKGVDLKVGDCIVNNNARFLITAICPGFGAGTEFGHYIEVTGNYTNSRNPGEFSKFWTFQTCPVIRLTDRTLSLTHKPKDEIIRLTDEKLV